LGKTISSDMTESQQRKGTDCRHPRPTSLQGLVRQKHVMHAKVRTIFIMTSTSRLHWMTVRSGRQRFRKLVHSSIRARNRFLLSHIPVVYRNSEHDLDLISIPSTSSHHVRGGTVSHILLIHNEIPFNHRDENDEDVTFAQALSSWLSIISSAPVGPTSLTPTPSAALTPDSGCAFGPAFVS
jgi:hypothetical protein